MNGSISWQPRSPCRKKSQQRSAPPSAPDCCDHEFKDDGDNSRCEFAEIHDEIELQLIEAERKLINDLYRDGHLKDEPRRRIERELDLREARLANERDEE